MKYLGPPQSGSLANQTFARNPFGQYVRQRGPANNTPSGARDASRILLAAAVATWQALTDADRFLWIDVAANQLRSQRVTGQGTLSGMDFFVSAYCASGGASISPVVGVAAVSPADPCLLFGDPPPLYSLNAIFVLSASAWVNIYTAGYTTTSTYSAPGRGKWWKKIGQVDLRAAGPFPAQFSSLIQPGHELAWGPVVVGTRTFCRVRSLSAGGVLSAPVSLGWIDWP